MFTSSPIPADLAPVVDALRSACGYPVPMVACETWADGSTWLHWGAEAGGPSEYDPDIAATLERIAADVARAVPALRDVRATISDLSCGVLMIGFRRS